MADISKIRHVVSGIPTTIDMSLTDNVFKAWNFKISDSAVSASKPLKLDATKGFISGDINLGTEVTGTLPGSAVQLAVGGGIKNATGLAVEPNDFAGNGLEDNGSDKLQIKHDGGTLTSTSSGVKVGDFAIGTAQISLSAGIQESKLSLDYSTSGLNTAVGTINGKSIAAGSGIYTSGTIATGLFTKLGALTENWDTTGAYVTVKAPASAGHAATKAYVDQLAITGGVVKEALLLVEQMDNTDGINAAEVLYFNTNPGINDTVEVKNAATTEVYTFKASRTGAFEVTIGVGPADTMENLAAAILLDSVAWDAKYTANGLDSINANGVVVAYEKATAAGVSASRIYGTWATQSDCLVVEYNGEIEYKTSKAAISLPLSDPGAGRFGMRKQASALVNGEIHLGLETDVLKSWNGDAISWLTLSGSGSLPDATSGSGGGIKGKVTADSDLGLSISSGVLSVKKDSSTISFNPSGQLYVPNNGIGTSQLASTSVTAGKLGVDVAGNGLQGGNGSAISVKTDGLTIVSTSSGIKVGQFVITDNELASNSVTSAKIAADAVGAAKIRLENNSYLRGRNFAGSGDINIVKVKIDDTLELAQLPYVPSAQTPPIDNFQIVNKKYVDDQIAASIPQGLEFTAVAGESLAANTSFLVRWAQNGETIGRVYKATSDHQNVPNKFYVIGLVQTTGAVNAGDAVTVIKYSKNLTLKSADANFAAATDDGKLLFLNKSGAFSVVATTGITATEAYGLNIIGVQKAYNATVTSSAFSIDCSLNGISIDIA